MPAPDLGTLLDQLWEEGLRFASLCPPDSHFQTLERRLAITTGEAARRLASCGQPELLEHLIDALGTQARAWLAWVLLASLTRNEEKLVECFAHQPLGWWESLGQTAQARWQKWRASTGPLTWCGERACFLPEQTATIAAPPRYSLAMLARKKAIRLARIDLQDLHLAACKQACLSALKAVGALPLDADPDCFALYSTAKACLPAEDTSAAEAASSGLLLVAAPAARKERAAEVSQLKRIKLRHGIPRFTQKMFRQCFAQSVSLNAPPVIEASTARLKLPRRATDRFLSALPAEPPPQGPTALEAAEIGVGVCLAGSSANVRLHIRTRRERVTVRTLRRVLCRALAKRHFSEEIGEDDCMVVGEARWQELPIETPLRKAGALMFVAREGTLRLTERGPACYALPLRGEGEQLAKRLGRIRGMDCELLMEIPRSKPPGKPRRRIFNCSCGRKLAARPEHAGKRTVCPGCGRKLTIPGKRAKS